MGQINARIRLLIADPNPPVSGGTLQFQDQDIQDTCDEHVDFIRYEPLLIAPTIINTASTGNQASTVFINYFSRYTWWEMDVTLQAYVNGQAWVVAPATSSDFVNGHFWFESPSSEFTTPTVPGQLPPVFATGKVYDLNATAADLLEIWASALSYAYHMSANGQSLHREQMVANKLKMAAMYRQRAKPTVAKMTRTDVLPGIDTRRLRLLDTADGVKGY